MILIIYKALAALLIFLISIVTVIYPLRHKARPKHTESFELGEAFASGIFLGAAFFHMLPNAIVNFDSFYKHIHYPIPEAICAGGFLLLLFLERLSLAHSVLNPKNTIPYILALILVIHSFTEGAALGIGKSFAEAFMIFIAIIAHKGSASFALCITLMRYHLPLNRIILIIIFFSLMTPLGIAVGAAINLLTESQGGELAAILFNAFAAGTFLYIATLHHIQFHQRLNVAQGLREFFFLFLGSVIMALIAVWA